MTWGCSSSVGSGGGIPVLILLADDPLLDVAAEGVVGEAVGCRGSSQPLEQIPGMPGEGLQPRPRLQAGQVPVGVEAHRLPAKGEPAVRRIVGKSEGVRRFDGLEGRGGSKAAPLIANRRYPEAVSW